MSLPTPDVEDSSVRFCMDGTIPKRELPRVLKLSPYSLFVRY